MATLYRRGDSYYLNWREGGHQYRRSLGKVDRQTAETLRAEKAAELRGLLTPTRGVTVGRILDDYLAWYQHARPTTYKRAVSALKPFRLAFDHLAAEAIPPRAVERWAFAQTAKAQAQKALKLARAAFRQAQAQRVIQRSPMDGASIPSPPVSRAPDYYRPDDLDKLDKTPHAALWRFFWNTGLRKGEMAKARRSDVRDGLLYVESTAEGRTKSGKWRAVPLNAEAMEALAHLGEDRLVDVHADTLGDWFTREARAVGLNGSLHWLRHTFCTILVQQGVSLHEVKRLAGHSSITVTEQYAHHAPGFGVTAVATMGAWREAGRAGKHTGKHSTKPKPLRPRSSAG